MPHISEYSFKTTFVITSMFTAQYLGEVVIQASVVSILNSEVGETGVAWEIRMWDI